MRSHSHLNTVKKIIDAYDGSVPLAVWLKDFFKSDKKFGSKDRKQIGHACYCYYRLGGAFKEVDFEERILIALYLCSNAPVLILQELRPQWNESINLPTDEKFKSLNSENELARIFPFLEELSEEIDAKEFNRSFLVQPDLYLRIRPGKKNKVLGRLQAASIEYALEDEDCIRLSNQSKMDEVLDIDGDVVVQDYNSQKTIDLLKEHVAPESTLSVWDCCAASGGKSILLKDVFPGAQLTVSDIRESILANLKKRFQRAGIKSYEYFVADISSSRFSIDKKFDVVICDAPCSGSGTWSRTPEQLYYFKKEKIDYYADLQKRIVASAIKALKPGGYLLYITCSVFKKENEEVVDFIKNSHPVKLVSMQYLKGYDIKADTLFAALISVL
ncbi:MAG: methyltransferase domain-containing protein [Flavisolibacter sp.]